MNYTRLLETGDLKKCFFKAGAHHTDLRAATKDDPEWLKQQRRQEVAIIEKWISEYYNDLEQEEQAK